MEVYWQFLLQHWVLSGVFVVLLILFAANELRGYAFGLPGVTTSKLVDLVNHAKAVVIDVRDKAFFDEGHILGAQHIAQSELEAKKKTFQKYKSRPIIIVCENGTASSKAGQWFLKQGFADVYYLQGGLVTWRSDNLPLSKN